MLFRSDKIASKSKLRRALRDEDEDEEDDDTSSNEDENDSSMTRASLIRLLERVAGQEERRAEKIIKSLIRADQRATLKEKKPIAKVDKFTKQMHHKRERQRINEELRRMTR